MPAPRQSRGDWRHELHEHLASLRLTPEREAEIIEELTHHLDTGIVASAVPARRAMRLDPTTALQAE